MTVIGVCNPQIVCDGNQCFKVRYVMHFVTICVKWAEKGCCCKIWHSSKYLKLLDFTPKTGWLDRFMERHGIVCRSISGESAVVDTDICDPDPDPDPKGRNWRYWFPSTELFLSGALLSHKACDIFNADETGLFHKLMQNKTLQLKSEKCHGGKKSKERLTVLVTSSMVGSEKIKLLVIGKFQNPRCFKGIKSLPVEYRWN